MSEVENVSVTDTPENVSVTNKPAPENVTDVNKDAPKPEDKPVDKKVEPEKSTDQKKDDKDKQGAPDTYEPFVVPNGVEIDSKLIGEFTPLAKELNLTQDQAQKLVDFQTKVAERMSEAQNQVVEKMRDGWEKQVQSDPEIGGKDVEAKLATARKALKALGTPELNEVLKFTGTDVNPEIIRLLYRVGKLTEEAQLHIGNSPYGQRKSAGDVIYTTMAKS